MNNQKTGGSKLECLNLLSCPFCGGDNVVVGLVGDFAEVQCDGCYARGGMSEDEAAAAKAWNMRSNAVGTWPNG